MSLCSCRCRGGVQSLSISPVALILVRLYGLPDGMHKHRSPLSGVREEDVPVGKKMSKYPCLTKNVSHGTMLPPYLVCTTGPFLPSTASGNESKSAINSLCAGNFSLNLSKKRTA